MVLDIIALLKCAVQGTSSKEQGKSVSVKPTQGETVLLFRSDSAEFRQCIGALQDSIACDIMVFYHSSQKTVICFVELKGRDVADGYEQLETTYKQFRQVLGDTAKNIVWCGVVRTSSSPPKPPKKRYELHIQTSGNSDIGDILRK